MDCRTLAACGHHGDAGPEQHGKQRAHGALEDEPHGEVGGEVDAGGRAVDGGIEHGPERQTEGQDVDDQDAEERDAPDGVDGLDPLGRRGGRKLGHGGTAARGLPPGPAWRVARSNQSSARISL